MAQFINSNKEYYWGDWYFKSHVMAENFDYKAHKRELSPYYQQHGFKVSMMFDDYFSRLNGIHSDRYLSMDLYYFYVIPALNRHDFKDAYLDKNIYSELFPAIKQPETIVKNIHAHYYIGGEEVPKMLSRLKGRLLNCHLKDVKALDGRDFCPLGEGAVDIPEALAALRACGCAWAHVEQDNATAMEDPYEEMRRSAAYLKEKGAM